MDTAKEPPTVLSVCVGCRGLERGLEILLEKITVLAYVEIDAYADTNLIAKMEEGEMAPTPIWTDVKTFPVGPFRDRVDILLGGYPCQPFSKAGKGLGAQDPRHLWPSIRRTIELIRPKSCIFENVEGHITDGLYDVLDDLGGMGYRSTWGIFSAAECGLPHLRERVFIVAHAPGIGSQRSWTDQIDFAGPESIQTKIRSNIGPEVEGRVGICRHEGYESEPLLPGGDDGLRNWHDRISLVGNAVSPMTAALAISTLLKEFE